VQTLDPIYLDALEHGHEISGNHLSIAEWSFNDIYNTTVVNDSDSTNSLWSYQEKFFPPISVVSGLRPDTGIFYAFTDLAYTSPPNSISQNRYYAAAPIPDNVTPVSPGSSISDVSNTTGFQPNYEFYQYWASPLESLPIPIVDQVQEYSISNSQLTVNYVEDNDITTNVYAKCNKIRVSFNLGPKPINWTIYVKYFGSSSWVNISTSPAIDISTGKCELWWNGTSWTSTKILDPTISASVCAIKIVIDSIDSPVQRTMINEISLRREMDITSRVIDWTFDYEAGTQDFIHPVGTMSASTGTINLNNYDLQIKETDPTTEFFGLLSGWCEYRVYINYDLTKYTTGPYSYIVQIATMYGNDYQQQNEYEYQIQLFDVIKRLQTATCPPMFIENRTLGMILSNILDNLGFDKYDFTLGSFDTSANVTYFWSDGTQTVFDVLSSLCESQQCAIFAVENGFITALTRNDIANTTDVALWTFLGENSGGRLADITYLNKKYTLQANDVLIQYSKMAVQSANIDDVILTSSIDPTDITSTPLTTQVFQSSDTVVLRASGLTRDLLASSESSTGIYIDNRDVWITSADAATWPFTGKVLIDSEYILYNGKGYSYWIYNAGTWTQNESIVTSVDDQNSLDQQTYSSFSILIQEPDGEIDQVFGGVSSNPAQQNGYTGRLHVSSRDTTGTGNVHHSINIVEGWTPMTGWAYNALGGHGYFQYDPSGTLLRSEALDWRTKPHWTSTQTKWTWKNSILTCNNITDGSTYPNKTNLIASYVRDLGSNTYKEFGTRLKLTGQGFGGIIFNMSNASGYVSTPSYSTDPTASTRFYLVNVIATPLIEASGRQNNEICVQVKNGNTITALTPSGLQNSTAGKIQIDVGTWYDIDIVYSDGVDSGGAGTMARIEVYVNGQFIDYFTTTDVIASTGLCGLMTRYSSTTDFEYFYANSITDQYSNSSNLNDEMFTSDIMQMPSGTNANYTINVPTDTSWEGRGVISFATTGTSSTINNITAHSSTASRSIGPLTINSDARLWFYLDDFLPGATFFNINYTSSQDISICTEYSLRFNLEYGQVYNPTVFNGSFNLSTGGFQTNKINDILLGIPAYSTYTVNKLELDKALKIFYDDFGSIVHEARDFDFYLDVSPALGTQVFSSNNNIRLVDFTYNPLKGIFTLVNCSHQNEVANGTQQIDANNSINQTLLVYGYALVNNGSQTKEVRDSQSIRKRGVITQTVSGTWIFNDKDAEDLASWIVENWSDPMDVIEIEAFSNSNAQLGDKVKVQYPNGDVDPNWLFIIIKIERVFDGNGFGSVCTLQRVR
jgi:hypothetical protein